MAAATVYLSETNGAGAVVTDNISNCNFGGVDQPNIVAATHPVVRAAAGTSYGFDKYWRFKVANMGTAALLQTFKCWKTAGAYVTAEDLRTTNGAAIVYATPIKGNTNAVASIGIIEANATQFRIGGSLVGTIVAAPNYTDYQEFVYAIGSTTPIGLVNQKTLIFQYDES